MGRFIQQCDPHTVTAGLILLSALALLGLVSWPDLQRFLTVTEPPAEANRPPSSPRNSPAEVLARVRPCIVTLYTQDKRGQHAGLGSGFLVAPGRVATNHHVIEGASRVFAKFADGTVVAALGTLAIDREADLAVIALDASAPTVRPLTLARATPRVGDPVIVVGSPHGLELSATMGIVSGLRNLAPHGLLLQIDAAVSPGSSGGPVLDARGAVIGVVRMSRKTAQNLNFAVPVGPLREMRGAVSAVPFPVAQEFSETASGNETRAEGESEEDYRIRETEAHEWVRVSRAHFGARRPEKAMRAAMRAVELAPQSVEALMALQWALEYLGLRKEEIPVLERVVLVDPKHAEAHERLGFIFAHLGTDAEREPHFMRYRIRAWKQYDIVHGLRPERAKYVRGAIAWDRTGRHTGSDPKPLR